MSEDGTTEFIVSEEKFNATATLTVTGAEDRKEAAYMARHYFQDEYGHTPSKIVAQQDRFTNDEDRWEVMVADHSSGSLKGSSQYEL